MRRPLQVPPEDAADVPQIDRAGLDRLYRQYAQWLKRCVGRIWGRRDPAGVEDAVQEAYIRIAPYLARGGVAHPRALLLRIAVNVVHDHHRHAARRQTAPLVIEDLDENVEHAHAADQLETVLLEQVVMSLPPNLRDVFVLSRYAALSNAQIAQRCGLSVKTVEERMTKALNHLARRLAD